MAGLNDALIGAAVGAWTGYITNDAALRMIFRAYGVGRLKFGGVIPNTRDQFIESLAALAENELLSGADALRRVGSDAFRDAAARLISVAAKTAADALESAGDGCTAGGVLSGEAQAGTMAGDGVNSARGAGKDSAGDVERELAGLAGAVWDETGHASLTLARTLLGGMPGALGRLAGAAAHSFVEANEELLRQAVRGAVERLSGCGELADGWKAAKREWAGITLRRFAGETLYGAAENGIRRMARYAGSLLENELRDDASAAVAEMLLLAVDTRATDRFFGAFGNGTLESILGVDRDALSERLATQARADRARDAFFGGLGDAADALSAVEELRRMRLRDMLAADGEAIALAIESGGISGRLSQAAEAFIDKHADEICDMAERALQRASDSSEQNRGGAVRAARRALIKGAGARFRVVQRLKEAAVRTIGSLATHAGADKALDWLLAIRLDAALEAASAMGAAATANASEPGTAGKPGTGYGASGPSRSPRDTGNGFAAAMISEALRAFFEIRPAALYARMSDAQKADLCLAISQSLTKLTLSAAFSPGAAQDALEALAASALETAGEKKAADCVERLATETGKALLGTGISVKPAAEALAKAAAGAVEQTARALADNPPSDMEARLRGAVQKTGARAVTAARQAMSDGRASSGIKRMTGKFSRSVARRLAAMIQGNVKQAIVSRLSGIDSDAFESLARRFFGSLRHIAVLGAILGAMGGLACLALPWLSEALGGLQGKPESGGRVVAAAWAPGFDGFATMAARMSIFALIGWSTNVLAVALLFRPKRPIRVFGLRVRSVVSANKARLADAVGRFLDVSLMDESAARHLVEAGERQHRAQLVGFVSSRAGAWISSALRRRSTNVKDVVRRLAGGLTDQSACVAADAVVAWAGRAADQAGMAGFQSTAAAVAGNNMSADAGAGVNADAASGTGAVVNADAASGTGAGVNAPSFVDAFICAAASSDTNIMKLAFGTPEDAGDAAFRASRAALRDLDPIWLRSAFRRGFVEIYGSFARWADGRALREIFSGNSQEADRDAGGTEAGSEGGTTEAGSAGGTEAASAGGAAVAALLAAGRGGSGWAAPAALERAATSGSLSWPRALAGALARALEAPAIPSAPYPQGVVSMACDGDAPQPFWTEALCEAVAAGETAAATHLVDAINRNLGFVKAAAWRALDGDEVVFAATRVFMREEMPAFIRRHALEADAPLRSASIAILRVAASASAVSLRPKSIRAAAEAAMSDDGALHAISEWLFDCFLATLGDVGISPLLCAIGAGDARSALKSMDYALRAASEGLAANICIEADDMAACVRSVCTLLARAMEGRATLRELIGARNAAGAPDAAVFAELSRNAASLAQATGFGNALARAGAAVARESSAELSASLASWLLRAAHAWGEASHNGNAAHGNGSHGASSCSGSAACDAADGAGCDALRSDAPGDYARLEALRSDAPGDALSQALDDALSEAIALAAGSAASFDSLWRVVAELAASSGFAALACEMKPLVSALELTSLATGRISAMDDEKIERVFKSFAQPYLRKIKLYGLFGGIFGVHAVAPAAALAIAIAMAVRSAARSRQRRPGI